MPETIQSRARFGPNSGQPMTRCDGIAKVTGAATFAADNRPAGLLHAVYVPATIARGRVTALDTDAAKAHPGVVEVFTPDNPPPVAGDPDAKPFRFTVMVEVLQDTTVRYANQPIALVLGESIEAANEGARLLAPQYEAETPLIGMDAEPAMDSPNGPLGAPAQMIHGDIAAGLSRAATTLDLTYDTPAQYHNAMETHAIVAAWDGDRLTIDVPTQALVMSKHVYGHYFDIPPENITIRCAFLGGGFGSKAMVYSPLILAVAAARKLRRPVKLMLRRDQMFGPVAHRGATRQQLRLGVGPDAKLTALDHVSTAIVDAFDPVPFLEPACNASKAVYATGALRLQMRIVHNHVGASGPMRSPGEASGSAALESAMDEMAEALNMDPLAFRLANYAETMPGTGKPFSSKALRECYAEGSRRFGWANRPREPRSMTDRNGLLVGWGMGTAIRHAPMFAAQARVTLLPDGTGLAETTSAEMGQGAFTALTQIAADSLGLPIGKIEFRYASSELPDGGVAGGSAHTATAGTALHNAGADAIARLGRLAAADPNSPLFRCGNQGFTARNGRLYAASDDSRSQPYADIIARAGGAAVVGQGSGARMPEEEAARPMYAHGAVFAEVKVDPELFQVRVTRIVGAFAAGRIINPRLAESQLLGGMIWGVGFALHEGAKHDARTGRIMNADLAGYHVPVNADIKGLEVIMVHEDDPHVNAVGIKGVGELGNVGTVGAIANAIRHATGTRVRRFPIRIEDLLAGN
ncbi:MAG: xanthine dehydrogenase family protein molybdopterin-binding subunit [Pseudomonadota bacterium]